MSTFFTNGRLALVTALQANVTLSAQVRRWTTWGAGLRKRHEIRPSDCPLLSVVPSDLDIDDVANAVESVPQDIEIGIATDGPDAADCELLVGAATDVLRAAATSHLGLADEGLAAVGITRIAWRTVASNKDARIRWAATIHVRLSWLRRRTS
jgi:hypothetical protein